MSTFLPRDLSEIAQRIGCVSQSNFFWVKKYLICPDDAAWLTYPNYGKSRLPNILESFPAFSFEDFAGTSEQNFLNRKIVFGEKILRRVLIPNALYENFEIEGRACEVRRIDMLYSSDFSIYLRPFLEGR